MKQGIKAAQGRLWDCRSRERNDETRGFMAILDSSRSVHGRRFALCGFDGFCRSPFRGWASPNRRWGAPTCQPRAERSGDSRKAPPWVGRNFPMSPVRAKQARRTMVRTPLFRPYRAQIAIAPVTQGGAPLCPGLTCWCPFGAKDSYPDLSPSLGPRQHEGETAAAGNLTLPLGALRFGHHDGASRAFRDGHAPNAFEDAE